MGVGPLPEGVVNMKAHGVVYPYDNVIVKPTEAVASLSAGM